MKKIKDPEKLIKNLKNKLKLMESSKQYWNDLAAARLSEINKLQEDAYGSYWFTYIGGVTTGINFSNGNLAKPCQIGKEVIIKGFIKEYKRTLHDSGNEAIFELTNVYLKD